MVRYLPKSQQYIPGNTAWHARVIECSVHGKCFNIGRRRAINLTQASNLEYKSHQHQCSVASVKLEGGVFENGLNIDEFIRAVRLTGLSVSAEKMKAVIHACTQATHEEYKEQQKLIGNEYKLEQNLKVGMDTSFHRVGVLRTVKLHA